MTSNESDWSIVAQNRILEKKTHASFPQIKYPSLRDDGIKDAVQWLKGKALDDGAEGLWRVHNKLYDLTNYIGKHPGGKEWLELTKGTDITEAFETHHIYSTAEKILNQFYVRDANGPRNSPFTFEEEGFYRTLKRAVRKELKTIPNDAIRETDRITDGFFLTLLLSSPLSCYFENYMLANLFYIVSSIALCLLTIACHNYIHQRTNWSMYLFNLCMWSYRDFRVSHVLSHHLYTNTLMDFDMSSLEPLLVFRPQKDKPLHAKMGFITECVMFPFFFLLNFCKRVAAIFIWKNFFKTHFSWHDVIGLLLPLWMGVTSNASWSHVIYTWLWILCTASFFFCHIAMNAGHLHPDAIKDGDEPGSETPDWDVHQIEALLDRKDVNTSTLAVMMLFGEHALHHLFPTLDHGILKYLHPVFLKHCEKYQANYRATTQFKVVVGQIKECLRTECTSFSDRQMFKRG